MRIRILRPVVVTVFSNVDEKGCDVTPRSLVPGEVYEVNGRTEEGILHLAGVGWASLAPDAYAVESPFSLN